MNAVARVSAARQTGAVTAETALALPAVVVLIAGVLAMGSAVQAQVQCLDAARAGARAAARGDAPAVVTAVVRQVAPSGARVHLSRSGSLVQVGVAADVRLPLPGGVIVPVRARALAQAEDPRLRPAPPP